MIDHILGRPSAGWRRTQVLATCVIATLLLRNGGQSPPVAWLKGFNDRLERLPAWKIVCGTLTASYFMRHIFLLLFLQGPEPLVRMYTRSFYRATWILTALDAGFLTAMPIKPKILRDFLSVAFSVLYLFNAEAADSKVRRYRSMATVEMMRISWDKVDNPILRMATRRDRPWLRFRKDITLPRPSKPSTTSFPDVQLPPIAARFYYSGTEGQLKQCEDLIFLIPGGGFVCMPPRCHDNYVSQWAKQTNRPIVAINYGKAPQYPYPWALEECFDAYKTVIETNGACLGMSGWQGRNSDGSITTRQPIRIVMAGDSAGGNLAAGLILKLLDLADPDYPAPRGVVLIYPCLSFDMACWMQPDQLRMIRAESSKSLVDLAEAKNHLSRMSPLAVPNAPRKIDILTDKVDHTPSWYRWRPDDEPKKGIQIPSSLSMTSRMSYFTDRVIAPEVIRAMGLLYLGTSPSPPNFQEDYYLSPVVAPDDLLARFPQCYLLCGEKDPFVDDTVVFASRLRDSKTRAQRELRRTRGRVTRLRHDALWQHHQAMKENEVLPIAGENMTNSAHRSGTLPMNSNGRNSPEQLNDREDSDLMVSDDEELAMGSNDKRNETFGTDSSPPPSVLPSFAEVPQIGEETYSKHPFARNPNSAVRFKILAGMSHGIFQMGSILPEFTQAVKLTARWLEEMLVDESLDSCLPSAVETEITQTVANAMYKREDVAHDHSIGFYNATPAHPHNISTNISMHTQPSSSVPTSILRPSQHNGHPDTVPPRRVQLADSSSAPYSASGDRYSGNVVNGIRRPRSIRNLNEVSNHGVMVV
ncbi:hypothetical protein SeMB42_g01623 [Synchytrium endobioticum]|uniref:Alpha/beta hydrolase fold-3 domain-containing protein n=1 Tax=Synchytrium endobioticum TaxID=286115 RepID=A0A507DKV2_9FUNG|nr:hypothetical protein SeMB42_g01623 [Synchytrium endobioticum]